MEKIFLYGRLANEPGFFRFDGVEYCEFRLECHEAKAVKAASLLCLAHTSDMEKLKNDIHEGDFIIAEGHIGTHINYTYEEEKHIILNKVELFSDWIVTWKTEPAHS